MRIKVKESFQLVFSSLSPPIFFLLPNKRSTDFSSESALALAPSQVPAAFMCLKRQPLGCQLMELLVFKVMERL